MSDIGDAIGMVFSTGFFFGGIVWIVNIRTRYRLRMEELKRPQLPVDAASSSNELAALREEIAKLRDTTTQYDMSVERALEDMRHRLSALEARGSATVQARESKEETRQSLHLGGQQ